MATVRRPPDADDIVERLCEIIEGMAYQFPDPMDSTALVSIPFAGQAFREFPLAFTSSDTADVLRVDTDGKRVNSFLVDDRGFTQGETIAPNDNQFDGVIDAVVTHRIRIWYIYQFAELDSKRRVRRTIAALRKTLNALPKLGFPPGAADFIEKHDGLQMPQIFSDSLEGVIVWIAAGELTVKVTEPRAS